MRSSVTREDLGVEPLILDIERSQLRWLGHLMPPGRLPEGGVPGAFHREETPGKTQDMLEGLCLPTGLGTPLYLPGGAGGRSREREVWTSLLRLLPPRPGPR